MAEQPNPQLGKFYDRFFEHSSGDGFKTFDPLVFNDSFTESKLPVLKRPIESLIGLGTTFDFNNFYLQVFLHMDRLIDYLAGEFDYSDDEFKSVSRLFTKGWYFGEVLVAYGYKYIRLEKEAALRQGGFYDPLKFDKTNKWRLYRRTRTNQGDYQFTSLITGVKDVKLDLMELVPVQYEGMGIGIQGFEIAKEYVAALSTYMDLLKVSCTRFMFKSKDSSNSMKVVEAITGGSTYYEGKLKVSEDTEVMPVEYTLPEHPQVFFNTFMNYYAEQCRRMGFVFSNDVIDDKMTTADHYKSLKMTSNVQNYFLQVMQDFTRKVKIKFPRAPEMQITLAYDVTGQGIPDNNKNVKKKWKYKGDPEKSTPAGGPPPG